MFQTVVSLIWARLRGKCVFSETVAVQAEAASCFFPRNSQLHS